MKLTIEQALQRGVDAQNQGSLHEAELAYRAILQVQPDHPDANHNLGLVAMIVKQIPSALPLFKMALKGNAQIEQYWISYIDALIQNNQIADARRSIKKAQKKGFDSDILQSLISHLKAQASGTAPSQQQANKLLQYLETEQLEDAEQSAISMTNQFPRHSFAWKVLGSVYEKTGRTVDAINAHQTAASLTPQDPEIHKNLGGAFKELDQLDKAEVSLRRAIQLHPTYFEAHYILGDTLQELNRLEEAKRSYISVIALKSNHVEAHFSLGNTFLKMSKFKDAEASFRKAIGFMPSFSEAHCNLAVSLSNLGSYAESETSFKQAISLKPHYAEAYNNLGTMLLELGRFKEAEENLSKAISLRPDYAEAHSNLGSMFKERDKYVEAIDCFREAILFKPNWDDGHFNLGVALFEVGQYGLAAEQFELAGSYKSRLYGVRCLFIQDERALFQEKFDRLLSEDDTNAVVGSLAISSNIKFGLSSLNPFCNDPLEYVVHSDLRERCDFESIFVATVRRILGGSSVFYREQELLTNGVQTSGNIFSQEEASKSGIEDIIRAEIEKYWLRFKDSEEGFITNWPASYSIKGWVVSMKSGGHLSPHMHDQGWISGSVYINVPPKSMADSGNLVLCLSDLENASGDKNGQQSVVDVVTGSLCLFPASLYHYTIPFEEKEDRLVLAFDVVRND